MVIAGLCCASQAIVRFGDVKSPIPLIGVGESVDDLVVFAQDHLAKKYPLATLEIRTVETQYQCVLTDCVLDHVVVMIFIKSSFDVTLHPAFIIYDVILRVDEQNASFMVFAKGTNPLISRLLHEWEDTSLRAADALRIALGEGEKQLSASNELITLYLRWIVNSNDEPAWIGYFRQSDQRLYFIIDAMDGTFTWTNHRDWRR